jgi:phospholipid-binding lipoprotein MlaA
VNLTRPRIADAVAGLRPAAATLLIVGSMALTGCATTQNPDPLEPWNRKVFAFNEVVDNAVLKPVATTYRDVVPAPVRKGATNFFNNVQDAWSAVNLVLQGRFRDGASDLLRFGTNTVFGLLGVIDVASELGLQRHNEDFGQTLGKWGLGPGAYIVWPILGPSTIRDSIALPIETQVTPETWASSVRLRNSLTATRIVNTRANLLQASSLLDDAALDKYSFLRDAFLQRRRSLVYDGNPPEDEVPYDEYQDDEDSAPAAPAAASAPLPSASAASAPAVDPAASSGSK